MTMIRMLSLAVALFFGACAVPVQAAERQVLQGHVPAAVAQLISTERLPGSTNLSLAIGLPLRNHAELQDLLRQIYDPANPNYHHYLTSEQFTDRFGPSEQDYKTLMAFAKTNGLMVSATHGNRIVLDVRGAVTDIERTFHVTMRVYPHPKEARTFYAPDAEPSVDLAVPILHIGGLDNYALPFPKLVKKSAGGAINNSNGTGSGPSGSFLGYDFRKAYIPGTPLSGTGQSVALFELDGYYAMDIANYEAMAGLPNVPLTDIPVNGGIGTPGANGGVGEVSLDIEMVVAMAPGLSCVYVYEGLNPDSVLAQIASDNLAKQISSSWGWKPSPDLTAEGIFEEMAAQGQTFFNAAGDSDAFPPGTADDWAPTTSTNIIQVGGTTLTTAGPGGAYVSETVWNWGNGVGSSGGISGYNSIPGYQQGIDMTACHGSTTMRNIPDVALTADNIYVIANNGQDSGIYGGTSCAAPLWAAFTALMNQQNGGMPVGFLNPAIYALGKRADYTTCLHDITTGNNFSASSPSDFPAVPGYDLCTGWGTPAGLSLINALTEPLQIVPAQTSLFTGPVGGPFGPAVQMYSLNNTGTNALNWQIVNPVSWLTLSVTNGVLAAGGAAATVTVSVASSATALPAGSYNASLTLMNMDDGMVQDRQVVLAVVTTPIITAQPANQAVLEGAPATFGVATGSNALMFYQWRHNGTNLADGVNVSGSSTTNLALAVVAPSDVGTYSVAISNAAGVVVSSNALLSIVPSLPVFTAQPTNQTALPGQTVTFTVASVGTHPFYYQWMCNGTNMTDGASAGGSAVFGSASVMLTLSNVAPASAGKYSVLISNSFGAVSSSEITLAVTSVVTGPNIELTRLYSFSGTDGQYPWCPLTQGPDGYLYGTTPGGGTNGGYGTIFRMTTGGGLTTLVSLNYTNGANPVGGLLLGRDGNFYGTTAEGGARSAGTVFRMMSSGILTTLVSFASTNGDMSRAGLLQTPDGALYGTTVYGGSFDMGTIFRVTTNGILSTLVSFNSSNGSYPSCVLIQGADGNLYGTTENGGPNDDGTIFRMTTDGVLTVLVSFNGVNGAIPYSGLAQDTDGSFYGTTIDGGTYGNGTVFKMTPDGTFVTLHAFTGGSDGGLPYGGLTLGVDGNLYGTTVQGGTYNYGTVFLMAPNGSMATLANFDGYQGAFPVDTLTQAGDGSLYGTANGGGAGYTDSATGPGALFKFDISGVPLITSQPLAHSAYLGANVTLNVAVWGSLPLYYEWLKDGNALADSGNLCGSAARTLTLTNVTLANAGTYSVIVSNALGSAVSSNATVSIASSSPVITVQPADQACWAGETAVFVVTAEGNAPLYYQWSESGTNLTDNATISGSALGTLAIANVRLADSGSTFVCLVSNALGAVTSQVATLTVSLPPPVAYVRSILGDPWGRTNNEVAMDRVFGTGNWQDLRYETLNPTNLFGPATTFVYLEGSANNDTAMQAFLSKNTGLIRNWVGSGGRIFFNSAPWDTSMNFGFGVTLTYPDYTATGADVSTNHPIFNGPFTPVGTSWSGNNFAHGTLSGNGLVAVITNIVNGRMVLGEKFYGLGHVMFGGMTDVSFHSPQPQASNLRENIIAYGSTLLVPPDALSVQPSGGLNAQGFQGGPFTPSNLVYALSNNGTNSLVWSVAQTQTWLVVSASSGTLSSGGATNVTVALAGAASNLLTGSYTGTITFSNMASGTAQTRAVALKVWSTNVQFSFGAIASPQTVGAPFGVTLSAQDISGVTVTVYQSAVFLAGTGDYGPTALIPTNAVMTNGVWSGTLAVNSPDTNVRLTANDPHGYSGTSTAFDVLATSPTITAQPTNQTACVGGSATFMVGVAGSQPLFYQWQFNAINLPGAIGSSLILTGVTTNQAGNYSVTISNAYGSATSSNAILVVPSLTVQGITLDRLYSFGGSDGEYPESSLLQAADGNFYGTTADGGTYGDGTIFRLATNGTLTTLISFNYYSTGEYPRAGLIQGTDGSLYGTTVYGGTNGGYGTVYRVTTNGALTTLVSLNNATNGAYPYAGLTQGADGSLYGTTEGGGASGGYGTVFRVTTNGVLTTLVSFNNGNGANPYAGLLLAADGNLYGTTEVGGANGDGTVFRVTTNGTLTTLASFNYSNGAYPYAGLVQDADGTLYGATRNGGTYGDGVVFKITPVGTFTNVYSFTGGSAGYDPYGGLLLCSDGNLYGTTEYGGTYGSGTVFRLAPNGSLTTLANFDGYQGMTPMAALIQGADGYLYGTTEYGGAGYTGASSGYGAVFRLGVSGAPQITLQPSAQSTFVGANVTLSVAASGTLPFFYQWMENGTNLTDGGNRCGTLGRMLTLANVSLANAGTYSVLVSNALGVVISSNALLSIASSGPVITQQPASQTVPPEGVATFTAGAIGNAPLCYQWRFNAINLPGATGSTLILTGVTTNQAGNYSVTVSNNLGTAISSNAVLAVPPLAVPGVTLARLYSFGISDGEYPWSPLVQTSDGSFYGTTEGGGTYGEGTVFRVTTNGALMTLVSFSYSNGENPCAGLTRGVDGSLYGTTKYGGTNGGYGTVFRVTTNGALTTLVSFNNATNGAYPYAGLIQSADGSLYGTTERGGTNGGYGTVFRVTTNGALTILVAFNSANGAYPYAGLVQAADANLYGTTEGGGTYSDGTVFRVTTNGILTTLVSFTYANGEYPYAGLVQGADGTLYGATKNGGAYGDGVAFKITPSGTFTNFYSFTGGSAGNYPYGGLLLCSDGNLYGTTENGGTYNDGTVFRLATNGSLTTLANFDGYHGMTPMAALIQGADGYLYGTTEYGGAGYAGASSGCGTVFRLGVSVSPLIANRAATDITGTSADLVGNLIAGNPSPFVWVYWGTTDGGTAKVSWSQSVYVGQPGVGCFSAPLTGLMANQRYWYTCYASNATGEAWAPASTNFTATTPTLIVTLPVSGYEGQVFTNGGQVTIGGPLTSNLVVTLVWAYPSQAALTNTANIVAGGVATNFTVTLPVGLPPGSQTGTVTASAMGFASSTASILVLDRDVTMSNVSIAPVAPQDGDNVNVSVAVSTMGSNSNLTVQTLWWDSFGATNIGVMAANTQGLYVTATPIPARPAGATVSYCIQATYTTTGYSFTTNLPSPAAPYSYTVRERSAYASMSVTGSIATNLFLVSPGQWQTAIPALGLTNPAIQFQALASGVTTTWGDSNQTVATIPVYGNAEVGAATPILMSGIVSSPIALAFNEQTGAYTIQRCVYENFDGWATCPFGTSTNDGWVLSDGRITNSATLAFRGSSAILDGSPNVSANSYLLSPYLTNGIGQISFWLRSFESDGSPSASIVVQKAVSPMATNWTTIATADTTSTNYIYLTVGSCDLVSHAIRIVNNASGTSAQVCLDEVIVCDPGAGVTYSNLVIAPATPTILTPVSVAVNIDAQGGATNLQAWLQFRFGTNGVYDTVAMTNDYADHFVTANPIPNGGIGIVQYFITCTFVGFQSAASSPTYIPANFPASYTSVVPQSSQTENFDTNWPGVTGNGWMTPSNAVNPVSGWSVNAARINRVIAGHSPPYEASLAASNATAWIQSPLLSNGVGSVTYFVKGSGTSPQPPLTNVVELSYDGVNWTTNGPPNIVPDAGSWYGATNIVDTFSNLYVRICVLPGTGIRTLMFDDIAVSYPASRVAISNVFLSPGYPSATDTVYVSFSIASQNAMSPAVNLDPTLYYRVAGAAATNFTPVKATLLAGNQFATPTGSIPSFPRDTKIEYYVQCNFNGYYGSAGENRSPAFYPAGSPASGPSVYTSYVVRASSASYGQAGVLVNGQYVGGWLLNNGLWQTVFTLPTPCSNLTLAFQASGYSTGNGSATTTVTWGNANVWQTALPLADVAVTGQTAVTINGSFSGSYVVRFNEVSQQYVVEQGVWQGFDAPADDTLSLYVQKAVGSTSGSTFQNFSSLPLDALHTRIEAFSPDVYGINPWTTLTGYADGQMLGFLGYDTFGCNFVTTLVKGVNAIATKPVTTARNDAFVTQMCQWDPMPHLMGLSTISCKYMPVSSNTAAAMTFYLFPTSQVANALSPKADYWWQSISNASFTWSSTNAWATVSVNLKTNATWDVIFGATQNMYIAQLSVSDWYATNHITSDGWIANQSWIETIPGTSNNTCRFESSRATDIQYLQTPAITSGVNTLSFNYCGATTNPVSFQVLISYTNPPVWTPLTLVSGVSFQGTGSDYSNFTCTLNSSAPLIYFRILNQTPVPGALLLSNIRITGYVTSNDWYINNAADQYMVYTNYPLPAREFYYGACYLNSNRLATVGTGTGLLAPNTNIPPCVRTPILGNGVGEISFWYRNWATNGAPIPARLLVQTSTTGGTGNNEWTTVGMVSNIVNTNDYIFYQNSIYAPDSRYVRICNDDLYTNPVGRVCLDNVLVTAPLATSLCLSNLVITPPIPLYTDRVDVAVDIYNLFYNPTNIQVQVVYGYATDYTSLASAPVASAPMSCIATNLSVPGGWYRFKTMAPSNIPPFQTDRYVKYATRATFGGYHAEVTSPNTNQQFGVVPTWYYPMTYYTNNSAYYVVYGCPTGAVWINEVNPRGANLNTNEEFVELCGAAGIDLSGWALEDLDSTATTQSVYRISNGTILPNMLQGFGFWVIGGNTVTNREMALTAAMSYPGGVRLRRSMGAYEQAVCYTWGTPQTALTNLGFAYIGSDLSSSPYSISATGTGCTASAFTTWTNTVSATPGFANIGQVFTSYVPSLQPPFFAIYAFWIDTNVWLRCTQTNGWSAAPWYTSNLADSNSWLSIPVYAQSLSASNCVLNFPAPTNGAPQFYRIVATNSP